MRDVALEIVDIIVHRAVILERDSRTVGIVIERHDSTTGFLCQNGASVQEKLGFRSAYGLCSSDSVRIVGIVRDRRTAVIRHQPSAEPGKALAVVGQRIADLHHSMINFDN